MFFSKGVLYGHFDDTTGANVMAMYTESHIMIKDVTIQPTTESRDRRSRHNPPKNRHKEIWSKIGRNAAISKTFHFVRPSQRQYRIRVRERGAILSCAAYSRSHCFTRIARDAVARLQTKAENHRELIRTEGGALGVREGSEKVVVELRELAVMVKLFSC